MESDDMQVEPETEETPATNKSTPALAAEANGEQPALDLPLEICTHCRMHSQPTTGSISLVTGDWSQRLLNADSLPAPFANNLTTRFADSIVPSEHGPPFPSSPRHVLVNVFRI